MTLEEANQIMQSRGCSYYDYTDKSLEDWHAHMASSETRTFTWLADDIGLTNTGSLVKYKDNTVYTWMPL